MYSNVFVRNSNFAYNQQKLCIMNTKILRNKMSNFKSLTMSIFFPDDFIEINFRKRAFYD